MHGPIGSLRRCRFGFPTRRVRVFSLFSRARWKGVFAGDFAKLWCFNVVFLWLVCGECAVKDGVLTVAFHCEKFSSVSNFIFDLTFFRLEPAGPGDVFFMR